MPPTRAQQIGRYGQMFLDCGEIEAAPVFQEAGKEKATADAEWIKSDAKYTNAAAKVRAGDAKVEEYYAKYRDQQLAALDKAPDKRTNEDKKLVQMFDDMYLARSKISFIAQTMGEIKVEI